LIKKAGYIMNKVKIFLGVACLSVALASAAFTTANAKFTDPEYYLTAGDTPTCEILPTISGCVSGTADCVKTVNGAQQNRPVFAVKTTAGECQTQLHAQ